MRLRGALKVIALALVANQILTTLFAYGARCIDPTVSSDTLSLFALSTSVLLGFWLQSDARQAFRFAVEHGLVKAAGAQGTKPSIDPTCPRRWLVTLYIELNPTVVGL